MESALWIVQVLLAVGFLAAGMTKVSQPKEKLAPQMPWVEDFPAAQVRLIGALELLAAIGLIVPAATRILPWLTPLAATGLVLVMIGAIVTHLRRKESPQAAMNVALLVLAAFIVVGRFALDPL